MSSTRKNIINYYPFFFIILIYSVFFQNYIIAQNIRTPEGCNVSYMVDSEYTPSQIARLNFVSDSLVIARDLNAVRLTDATHTYSCHSYAWYVSEGGTILPVAMAGDILNYFNDGSYSYEGSPSYLPSGWQSGSETEATHTLYSDDNHSARKIQNSYPRPVEGGRDYVSKWGDFGLYQHAKNHDIYYNKVNLGHFFKKLRTTHEGILTTNPKTWIGAGGITHTITGNLTINIPLTIMQGATVNFQNGITVTVNSNVNFNSSLTIPTGVTLIINSGVVLSFASGTSLTINGTLNANGATFIRSGSSGTWGGIRFNPSSSGTLQNCNVILADYGIYVYNCSPTITNNTIQNCDTGIYCDYFANPILYNNAIQYNSSYGVRCNTYSSPNITNGTLQSGNVIRNNSISGISASYGSNPNLGSASSGGNSIYSNGLYAVIANYSSTISAKNNWWGTYPVPSGLFSIFQSSVDYTSALDYNPNYKVITSKNNSSSIQEVTYSIIGNNDDELDNALEQQKNKNWDVAIGLYTNVFVKNKTLLKGKYALTKIEECFTQSSKKDFLDYSKKILKPELKESDEAYVTLLELEIHQLVNAGRNDEALTNLLTILKKYNLNEDIDKNTLYRIGVFYIQLFGDNANAEKYFSVLKNKYPEDELTKNIDVVKNLFMVHSNQTNQPIIIDDQSLTVEESQIKNLALSNYPNPFNPTTNISFSLPQRSNVKLVVYDALGREVTTLANNFYEAGKYSFQFNGSNLSSGMYFYTLTTSQGAITKKMLLVK